MKEGCERRRPSETGLRHSGLAVVALGSNLGDSAAILRVALDRLQAWSRAPLLRSSFWRSTPVDCPPGSPDFLNAVAGLVPLEEERPESLLEKLQSLERELGRRPKTRVNEPRELDLDLICFGQELRGTGCLVLPHPRAHRRRFVLAPLAEVAPGLVLPGQGLSVHELLTNLTTAEVVERVAGGGPGGAPGPGAW